MVNEKKKDFNKMLQETKGMPKIKQITDEKSIEKYGGENAFGSSNGLQSNHGAYPNRPSDDD